MISQTEILEGKHLLLFHNKSQVWLLNGYLPWSHVDVNVTVCMGQAERLMEALEIYKEETAKLLQHQAQCKAARKQVLMEGGSCTPI